MNVPIFIVFLFIVIGVIIAEGLILAIADKVNSDGLEIFINAIIISVLLCYISADKNNEKRIDLPEEYKEISKNESKPDTLLGHYQNDTLIIGFKSKH